MKLSLRRHPRRVRLVRHERSVANEILQTAMDEREDCFHLPVPEIEIPLVPSGEKRVSDLGFWMWSQPERPSCIVSSKYWRAEQTRFGINRMCGNRLRTLKSDSRFNERNWGIFSGITEFGVQNIYADEFAERQRLGEFRYRPPGGESRRDIKKRLIPALEDTFVEAEGEDLVLVLHSEIVLCSRLLIEGLTEAEAEAIHSKNHVPNGSVTSYLWTGRRFELEYAYFTAPRR